MERQIDYAPLTERIDKAALRRSPDEAIRTDDGREYSLGVSIAMIVLVGILPVVFTLFFVAMALLLFTGEMSWMAGSPGSIALTINCVLLCGLLYWLTLRALRDTIVESLPNYTKYRFQRFTDANGLRYSSNGVDPRWPGMVFGRGTPVTRSVHFFPKESNAFEYGNMARVDGSNRGTATFAEAGYLSISLDKKLPNIVLEAKGRNLFFSGSAIDLAIDTSQKRALEGDIGKHFTLYCPEGFEEESLQIFTPDLLSLCSEGPITFDIEIVEDRMFFYQGKIFKLLRAATHKRLLGIVDIVTEKALIQTERYRDDSMTAGLTLGAAPKKQRLETSKYSVSGVLTGVLIIAVAVYPFFLPF